jgi:hypothetical protein
MPDHVELKVTFLPPDQGGRACPLSINGYRPHLRVPPDETMLGVEFVGPDGAVPVGTPVSASAKLVYAPDVSYSALQLGAAFEVLEGPHVVGHGRVVGLGSRPNNSFKPKPLRGSA